MNSPTFNLLDEPWIPVLYHDGRWERVGILRAFQDAKRIRQIAASNPMDNVATLRLLIAVVYWCCGNPREGLESAPASDSYTDCVSKLEENRECFNLLGNGERFYQDRAAQRKRATTDLMQEIPTGNNFWHFRHSTDFQEGLCLPCCALGLLRLPLFSVSGLPDLKAGINGTPPIYVVPLGSSLSETLLLNWIPIESIGEPSWTHPKAGSSQDKPVPMLTGLTMLSRRVRLHDPIHTSSKCIGCGAPTDSQVVTCEFQSAGEQKSELWNDPHVIYTKSVPRKASKAQDLSAAGSFKMDRPWTYLLKSLMDSGKIAPCTKPTTLLIVGFATDKAKNIDVWQREVTVPSNETVDEAAVARVLKWHKEGLRLEKRIGRWEKQRTAAVASVRPDVEHRVSTRIGSLILSADEAWCETAAEYRPVMNLLASSLYPGFTVRASRQRKEVSRVTPYMRSDEKPEKKKGGKY